MLPTRGVPEVPRAILREREGGQHWAESVKEWNAEGWCSSPAWFCKVGPCKLSGFSDQKPKAISVRLKPSLDALNLQSDVVNAMKILSLQQQGALAGRETSPNTGRNAPCPR